LSRRTGTNSPTAKERTTTGMLTQSVTGEVGVTGHG
jgi:hypothetical protein